MKANLKRLVVFIATAAVLILVISTLAAAPASAIDVKGSTSTTQEQTAADVAKPQAVLNDYENAVAALINSYRVASGRVGLAGRPSGDR